MRGWATTAGLVLVLGLVSGEGVAQTDAMSWPRSAGSWHYGLVVERVAEGLGLPTSIAFVPGTGELLVTDRHGRRIVRVDPVTGSVAEVAVVAPLVDSVGSGLHDLVAHPEYGRTGWIYFTYTALVEGGGTTLALDRARLGAGGGLEGRERLFTARPAYATNDHFGGRMLFRDGHLYVTSGDRLTRDSVQVLTTHTGKILRLREDGGVPADNPFAGVAGALPEIWTVGHRNPQGLVVDGAGRVWSHEHGPRGGDEVNLIDAGRNYGWPRVTRGGEYEGGPVGDGRASWPGVTPPVFFYRPSVAPGGLELYTGGGFPEWRGALLVGAMAGRYLGVLTLEGDRVVHEERVLTDLGQRIRSVRQGPDGWVYVGTDAGLLLRLRREHVNVR